MIARLRRRAAYGHDLENTFRELVFGVSDSTEACPGPEHMSQVRLNKEVLQARLRDMPEYDDITTANMIFEADTDGSGHVGFGEFVSVFGCTSL